MKSMEPKFQWIMIAILTVCVLVLVLIAFYNLTKLQPVPMAANKHTEKIVVRQEGEDLQYGVKIKTDDGKHFGFDVNIGKTEHR